MIGRIRNSEANCMSKVTFFAPQMCCPRFRETFIWILGADCRKWRQFVEKDIPSGEDVFNRLHKHLLMTRPTKMAKKLELNELVSSTFTVSGLRYNGGVDAAAVY
eukprot:scaffold2649_cov137-Cylindrotheca_fusiformis.AAC.7